MDFSSIATAIASLKSAQELATATLSVRDFNQSAAAISQINEKLLAAQQGLLAHNTMLLQLQNEHFHATEELRKLRESIEQEGRYPLVDIGNGALADAGHIDSRGHGEPEVPQPEHYLCQGCWDIRRVRSILQPSIRHPKTKVICNNCSSELSVRTALPRNRAPTRARSNYLERSL